MEEKSSGKNQDHPPSSLFPSFNTAANISNLEVELESLNLGEKSVKALLEFLQQLSSWKYLQLC